MSAREHRRTAAAWLAGAALALDCAARQLSLPVVPHVPSSSSVSPHPVPVQETSAPETASAETGPRLRIGVAPFTDARFGLSREPQRPPLALTWLGVVREGENSTGDRSFVDALTEGARLDAAATLAYSELFTEVRRLDDESLPPDLDYMLLGEIEEMVGFQYQRWSLGLLWPPGVFSRFEPPVGTARLRFRLIGRSGEIWRERIETRLQTPGVSMEQAALDALAVTHERLVVELYRRLMEQSRTEPRRLDVRVLDACGLEAKQVRRAIADASEVFEREMGVELRPSVETWVRTLRGPTTRVMLEAVSQEAPPPGGIVLALVPAGGTPSPIERERSGLSRQLGRHAVVACAPVLPRTATIAHEIGHLFGAIHSRKRGSIMYPVANFDGRFFDTLNRRILRSARLRDFDVPLDEALARQLRELYGEAAQDSEQTDAADLRRAERALR